MALDNFHVDWNTNVMQSFYQGSQQRNAVPDSPIKHFFTWYEVTSRGRTRAIGERFKHLFFSTLNLPDDDEWRFERPMGKGSFGAAALFSKVNQRQERTDAFVLKVTDADPHHFLPTQSKKSHLTQEAAMMAQTNDRNSDVLLRLRQYKVDDKYCRYYTEFCEFGTLEILRLRYKAWNKYFPELFLWHVFHCLAKAYLDFVRGRWRSLRNLDFGQSIPGQYLLHNDLKTDNIFLAANASGGGTVWYPKPKVGDFGLANTTHADEAHLNYANAMQAGTPCWHPPEKRLRSMSDFRYYYFGQDIHPTLRKQVGIDRKFHRIRPESNIWAIGAIMWSLVTLDEIESLSAKVDKILTGQNATARSFDGTNILKRPDPEIKRRYSPKLWQLICECTKMKPGDRPPPSRLLVDIETAMAECMERESAEYSRTGNAEAVAVAFIENQIDHFPDGGAKFHKHMNFWNEYADHLLWTPQEWGPLCPPEAPQDVNFAVEGMPSPLVRRQVQRWEEVLEERDRRRAAQIAAASQPTEQPQTLAENSQNPFAAVSSRSKRNRCSNDGLPLGKRTRLS